MNHVVQYEVATYRGEGRSRLWDLLLITNGAFILRPIRLLDLADYFSPDDEYLRRRYGSVSRGAAAHHLLRASRQYARMAVDTIYYTLERYRRLKAIGQSASFFNRLEVEA